MQTTTLATHDDNSAQLIQLAQDYAAQLQSGNDQQAEQILEELYTLSGSRNQQAPESDKLLYQEVGKLTRELHESFNEFMQDSRMQLMTSEDMPDARARLEHVIELTEKSAHETMSSIEHSSPLVQVMHDRASELHIQLSKFMKDKTIGEDNYEGMGYLADELIAYLELVSSDATKISGDLNKILMAQSYQDLTGQVIQRVSTLVQEVEKNLLTLLQIGGTHTLISDHDEPIEEDHNNTGYGPAVPGVSKGDSVQSQEEVDDLLSSLGF